MTNISTSTRLCSENNHSMSQMFGSSFSNCSILHFCVSLCSGAVAQHLWSSDVSVVLQLRQVRLGEVRWGQVRQVRPGEAGEAMWGQVRQVRQVRGRWGDNSLRTRQTAWRMFVSFNKQGGVCLLILNYSHFFVVTLCCNISSKINKDVLISPNIYYRAYM